MAVTIKWSIKKLTRELTDDYVMRADYVCEAIDTDVTTGGRSAYGSGVRGYVYLKKPSTLVPYADLTETQVIGWVKDALKEANSDSVDDLENDLNQIVSEKTTPTKAEGIPWS
jgi:hypothetical protein